MVEHGSRSGQIFQQDKGSRSPGAGGGLPKESIWGRVRSLAHVFLKPLGLRPPSATGSPLSASSKIIEAALNIHKLDLKTVNQVLILVLVGLVALAFYSGFSEHPDISSLTAAVSKIRYEPPEETPIASFEDLSSYQDQIKTRDIFNEYQEPKPPAPVVEKVESPPPPKVTIQEKAKDLKLMGISWGGAPKAMIKNEATGEVLFLEKGQKVKGTDVEVKSIDKEKVIIASDGDEMKML